jgi:uracil-DNA glycosylase family 4
MPFTEPPRDCDRCPRLRAFLLELRERYPDYHNAPVPSFGDPRPELLIVGLAPGMHGANQTGRPFTGDWAGDLLYSAIERYGFSKGQYGARADDGLLLEGAMITNAVRCLPPQNKPVGAECTNCRPFLADQIASLPSLRALLCLGKVSHDNTVRALGRRLKDFPFGHGTRYKLSDRLTLFSSYHCSRYNTNTKRLTEPMFMDVFADIRVFLDNQK